MASPDPDISFNLHDNDTSLYGGIQHSSPDNPPTLPHGLSTDQPMSEDRQSVHVTQDPTLFSHNNNSTIKTPQFGAYSRPRYENQGDFVSSAAPMIHYSLMKPDTFDGSHDFEAYMSHFEDCAELSGWDIRTKCLILASCLRGSARACYMSLSIAERRDYGLLCRQLAARFGNNKPQQMWLAKFESRHRQRGESIASLADDLRQLAQRAFSDLDVQSQEHLALNMLYKQVSPDMQCRCIDNGCTTIIQAVSVIERYEAVLGTQSSLVRALKEEVPANSENDIRKVVEQMESRLDRLEKVCPAVPFNQNSWYRMPQSRSCFGCKAMDHLWRNCPHNTDRNRFFNQQTETYSPEQGFRDGATTRHQHSKSLNNRSES